MPDSRPNILLILTDQHRLSAVGCYGRTPCRTPHIDRLAREGVRFEYAYTTCTICSPARATIITGQYPHNHGMVGNVEDIETPVHELPDTPHLLSRKLQSAGYRLGYTGKWHLGSAETRMYNAPITPCLPKDVGFEGHNVPGFGDCLNYPEYASYMACRGFTHRVKPWFEKTVPYRPDAPGGVLEQPIEGTVDYFLAENTISLIDQFTQGSSPSPFFIWHNFWGPHSPYYVTQAFLEPYRAVEIPKWPSFEWPARETVGPHRCTLTPNMLGSKRLAWEDWAMAIRYYYAFTTLIDDQIGRMISHLEKRGLLENTVVIFTADHGELLGDHGGLYNKGWSHFEETHRIPFIIRMPGGTGRGRVERNLVSLVDLYPTVLELAGASCEERASYVANPPNWPYRVLSAPDGRSLLPLIWGTVTEWRDCEVVEFHGLQDTVYTMRSLRYKDYKYGFNLGGRDELYNLSVDPHELRNVIDEPAYRDAAREVRLRLFDWMRETRDPALGMYRQMALWDMDV